MKMPISPTNETSPKQIASSVIAMLRNSASFSNVDRYRMPTNATAVASIEAIQGTCSLISIPNACRQTVSGFASIRNLGYWLRSVVSAGGVAR